MKPGKRWAASERIAAQLLESKGFQIIETRKRVKIEGVDVAEIDIVAKGPDGKLYAVEVKAGKVNVQGVRQAYANAALIGAKPLIVCKGFTDEAAEKTAKELGVEVITLEDLFLTDPEELEDIVYHSVASALAETVNLLLSPAIKVRAEQLDVLKAIVSAKSIEEAAQRAGRSVRDVLDVIKYIREISPLARRGYKYVQLIASVLLLRFRLEALLSEAENVIEKMERILERLRL